MASGDPVLSVLEVWPPQTLSAMLTRRAGGSTPAEGVNIWQFDPGIIWYLDFLCVLEGYGGGGLTFFLPWTAATAVTLVTRWGVAVRRRSASATVPDIDSAHTYVWTAQDATAPATNAGIPAVTTIAVTNGANMDGWTDGEHAIVRIRREATHANDTMAGFAELWGLWAVET